MDLLKHNPQSLPHNLSPFQNRNDNLSGGGQGKWSSSPQGVEPQNKIEVTLEELSAFFDEQVKIFYGNKSNSNGIKNKKIQEFKVRNATDSVKAINQKANIALRKIENVRSIHQAWRTLESAGSLFKGIALSNIQNPLFRALATIFKDSAKDKESAMAYLAYQVFSGSLSLSRRSRRNKILGIRLLRRMAPKGTGLDAIGKRLSRRRGRTRDFESIKQELYILAQGFETEGYSTEKDFSRSFDNSSSGKLSSLASQGSQSAYAKDNTAPKSIHPSKAESASNIGSASVIPPAPALTGVNNVKAPSGSIPIPPPPPPPPPGINNRASRPNVAHTAGNSGSSESKPKHTAPKTEAQRLKCPFGVNPNAVVANANDIIQFDHDKGVIIGFPKISPEAIAKVSPDIIAKLNTKQLKALNAYYWANLTDEQQKALKPQVVRELVNELNNPAVITLSLTDKAQNLRLKLACLNKANVSSVLGEGILPNHVRQGGYFDQNTKAVLRALGYQLQVGEVVDRVSMDILDGFYDKIPAKPARPQVGGAQSSTKQSLVSAWEKVFIPRNIQRLMDQPKPSIFDEIKYKKQVKEYKENNPDIFSSDEWIAQLPQDIQDRLQKPRPETAAKAALDYLRANPGILLKSRWMELLPQELLNEKQGLEQGIQNGSLDKTSQAVKDFVKKACECKRDHPNLFAERIAENSSQESYSESSSFGSSSQHSSSRTGSQDNTQAYEQEEAGDARQTQAGKNGASVLSKMTHVELFEQLENYIDLEATEALLNQLDREEQINDLLMQWGRDPIMNTMSTEMLNAFLANKKKQLISKIKTAREYIQKELEKKAKLNQGGSGYDSASTTAYTTSQYNEQGHGQTYGDDEFGEDSSDHTFSGSSDWFNQGGPNPQSSEQSRQANPLDSNKLSKIISSHDLVPTKTLNDGSIIYLVPRVKDELMSQVPLGAIEGLNIHQLLKLRPSHLAHMTEEQKEALNPELVYQLAKQAVEIDAQQKSKNVSKEAKERLVYLDRNLVTQKVRAHEAELKKSLSMMQQQFYKAMSLGPIEDLYRAALKEYNLPEGTPCLGINELPTGKLNLTNASGKDFLEQIKNMRKRGEYSSSTSESSEKADSSVNGSVDRLNNPEKAIAFFNTTQRATIVSKILNSEDWKNLVNDSINELNKQRELVNTKLLEDYPENEYPREQHPQSVIKPLVKASIIQEVEKDFNDSYQSRINLNEKNRYELQFEKAIQDCFDAHTLPLDADEAKRQAYFNDLQQRLDSVLEGMVKDSLERNLRSFIAIGQSKLDEEKQKAIESLSGKNSFAEKMKFRNQGFHNNDSDEEEKDDGFWD